MKKGDEPAERAKASRWLALSPVSRAHMFLPTPPPLAFGDGDRGPRRETVTAPLLDLRLIKRDGATSYRKLFAAEKHE